MITVEWLGPYSPGEVMVPGVGIEDVEPGQQLVVSSDVAGGMLAADESWWSATVDGGNASSTYTDGIDGGTSKFVGNAPFVGPRAAG